MIVIPMAGRSQRFYDAGHTVAKYRLLLGGESVFAHAVGSFASYFQQSPFLFIVGPDPDAAAFVRFECERLGIADARVVTLDGPTAGQAETVELGAAEVEHDAPLTIFNIDTFRPGFEFPGSWFGSLDGWLEVFRGEGANWSYVRPAQGEEPLALETAEKKPISDLCCTGLYHFARAGDFRAALAAERRAPQAPELYVAPLYNHLIGKGARIGYSLIDSADVIFCGTPAEYEALSAPA
ncbi:MAG TPA: glycosyltransferase family 2 protein [Phenylobacterium sp.]|nr:glycosyltransferase family 2 protein [Phenylobacterium sp.]